jgi:hypothetical protein
LRKEMMLDMKKHVERNDVFESVPQRARDVMGSVTIVVHGPYTEKGRQTLPYRHGRHVITQSRNVPNAKNEGGVTVVPRVDKSC